MATPIIMGSTEMVDGWVPTMVIGGTLLTTTKEGRSPIRTITIGNPSDKMATNREIERATKTIPPGGLMPGSMKLCLVVSVIQNAWACPTLRSTQRRKLSLCKP